MLESGVRFPLGPPHNYDCHITQNNELCTPNLKEFKLAAHRPNLPALKAEIIRLRVEERMSLKDIWRKTGASLGSLSLWLKPYPMTSEEKSACLVRARQKAIAEGRVGNNVLKPRLPICSKHQQDVWTRLTTSGRGAISEMQVMCRLMKKEVEVYRPVADGCLFDILAVSPHSGVVKIQVKTVKTNSQGLTSISLKRTRGHNIATRYAPGEFDVIVGYDPRTDTAYVFTEDEVSHLKTGVSPRPDAAERWDKIINFGATTPQPFADVA